MLVGQGRLRGIRLRASVKLFCSMIFMGELWARNSAGIWQEPSHTAGLSGLRDDVDEPTASDT